MNDLLVKLVEEFDEVFEPVSDGEVGKRIDALDDKTLNTKFQEQMTEDIGMENLIRLHMNVPRRTPIYITMLDEITFFLSPEDKKDILKAERFEETLQQKLKVGRDE